MTSVGRVSVRERRRTCRFVSVDSSSLCALDLRVEARLLIHWSSTKAGKTARRCESIILAVL